VVSKPSLLIATPAYGGMFTQAYVESLLDTWDWLGSEKIPAATYFIQNESLITRARNTCATLALEKKIDKLLFIDADIGWRPEDISRLYYSERKIIGGLYPHKAYPVKLNWNPLTLGDLPDEKGEMEVRHIATGFLMIDRSVLEKMSESAPQYGSSHMNGKLQKFYDFFRVGADSEGGYLSEDWHFCEEARKLGIKVWANAGVQLTHTGTHTFKVE
jgi:glycosyltransferase involved in cell wall biosynthesis